MWQRKMWSFVLCLMVTMVVACAPPSNQTDGYAVLFDDRPYLYDTNIYYYGSVVGAISEKIDGPQQITRITVQLAPEFLSQTGDRLAFVVHAGRMEAFVFGGVGRTVDKGAVMSGFVSRRALQWFKIKYLFRDRVAAADRRAKRLNNFIESSMPS